MNKALIVRKVVEQVVRELKSSNMHPSDADWYIGFGDDVNTANESAMEFDPKTGKVAKNNMIGDYTTFLQQWDADNVGYVEEDEKRDSGLGYQMHAMDQITPIK